MAPTHNVTLIGSGNLAWHLAPALDNVHYPVKEVYSRRIHHAEMLVSRLYDAEACDSLDFSSSPSTIFIVAVTDDAIQSVAERIVLPENGILIHTSGSKPLETLAISGLERTGVFYPLQTFTKNHKVEFDQIPIFIESNNPHVLSVLQHMGSALSKKVIPTNSAQRKGLHVAAVFASNFTNHMLTLAQSIMQDNKLDYEWLHPLVIETINKSLSVGPEAAQTGPARRGDLKTLDSHYEFLASQPDMQELYKEISQHILDHYES